MDEHARLRLLPSVEGLVGTLEARGLLGGIPRRAATLCAREVLDDARHRLRSGGEAAPEALVEATAALLRRRFDLSLRRAVNATGVVLHTNLGRAPLSDAARAAVLEACVGYSTLEINLEDGSRGARHAHIERLLTTVTGAEAGFAVNNNAAAVTLALAALAGGREVVVARGELVEIGGSFRMPDVMAQSGARLVEVGTTNRTYLSDYEAALGPQAALLLKVHRSNFTLRGFVHDVSLQELATLGQRRSLPVVYDLGSGCLVDLGNAGLPAEPTIGDAVGTGADLVLCSGDKLLGGPQAGLVVGRRDAVERCRRHPLARAMRLDKLSLAALAATLQAYLDPARAWREIPVLMTLGAPPARRRRRAAALARALSRTCGSAASVSVVATTGEVGGGSLPDVAVPSFAVAVRPERARPEQWAARLRAAAVPVVAVVRDDALLLDVLAMLPGDERLVRAAVADIVRPA
ncbi:MAG: L-seryl-tRNA(Sec) selenium transferase [Armatimonadetes bacterium]|nr:L-seryl-tRNA(Sec) selenium transferase [Armatimonadota bacterium]